MSRPRSDARVEFRTTTKDLRQWQAAADAAGLSLSAWVRMQCDEAARRAR